MNADTLCPSCSLTKSHTTFALFATEPGEVLVGKPEFIKEDRIRDGTVVVDAGYRLGGVGYI